MAADTSEIAWRNRLTVRLLFLTAGVCLLIGLMIAAVQVALDVRALRSQRDAIVEQTLRALSEPATEAVYNIDSGLAHRVVKSLMGFPGVQSAELKLSTGEVLARDERAMSNFPWRRISDGILGAQYMQRRQLRSNGNEEPLGEIVLYVDNAVIAQDFVRRSVSLAFFEPLRALVLGVLLFALLYKLLHRPLLDLILAMERVNPREPEMTRLQVPSGHESDELGRSVVAFNRLLDSIRESLGQRREAEARASFLSEFDEVTQLPNRRMLLMRLGHLLSTMTEGQHLAVMHVDLIDFNGVNQHLGDSGGDAALLETGRRLQSLAAGGSLLARMREDSFAIAVPLAQGGKDEARVFAKCLLAALSQPFSYMERKIPLHAALGIALFPDDADGAEALLQYAEQAHANAASGSDPIRFHIAGADAQLRLRRRLGRELAAVDYEKQFHIDYQPLINAQTGEVEILEALVRWRHPELGLLSPSVFIPIAEQRGAILALGDYVLRSACADIAAWKTTPAQNLRVAVNVSAVQLRDPKFDLRLAKILDNAGLSPQVLELEITESTLVENFELARHLLQRLRTLGVSIAIDDFGTGHASLSYLKRLPIDKLKIDGSFVGELPMETGDAQIIRAIINLGHSLGLRVVAEGVETSEQASALRGMQCDLLQGFLFSRPLAADRVLGFLMNPQAVTAGRVSR